MPRAQDMWCISRPGEGPLVVTLAGVLLINLTVLCVIVGLEDSRGQQTPPAKPAPAPAAGPSPTPAPNAAAQPGTPSATPPRSPEARVPAEIAGPTDPVEPPAPVAAPFAQQPPVTTPSHQFPAEGQAEPPIAPSESPQSESVDPPVMFFGVPAE